MNPFSLSYPFGKLPCPFRFTKAKNAPFLLTYAGTVFTIETRSFGSAWFAAKKSALNSELRLNQSIANWKMIHSGREGICHWVNATKKGDCHGENKIGTDRSESSHFIWANSCQTRATRSRIIVANKKFDSPSYFPKVRDQIQNRRVRIQSLQIPELQNQIGGVNPDGSVE